MLHDQTLPISDEILQTTNVHVPLVGHDDQAIKSRVFKTNNRQKIMLASSQCSKLKLVERNRAQLYSRSTSLNRSNGLFQH